MTDLTTFKTHAAIARRDPPPSINIADQVLAQLDQEPPASAFRNPYLQLSLAASLAACIAVLTTIPIWSSWQDPMVHYLIAFNI